MKVLMLIVKRSCGKTTTINKVFRALEKEARIVEEVNRLSPFDFSCIVEYKGKKIAFYSMGDYARALVDAMKEYAAKGCDLLVCACNERFKTPIRQLNAYPGFVKIDKTVVPKEPALMEQANTKDANKIVEMINDSVI